MKMTFITVFSSVFLLMLYMQPIFAGQLFYDELQISIPNEYFEMYKWFETQPKEVRIANLPMDNSMNWNHYTWGYRGSGFLWYGIEQPILDRSFDPWNTANEQYYLEMQYAIDNMDLEQIKRVMGKYQVGWLMYDKNIITSFGADTYDKFYQNTFFPKLLSDKDFDTVETFGNLIIIEYSPVLNNPHFIQEISFYTPVAPVELADNPMDVLYTRFGNYVYDEDSQTTSLFRDIGTDIANLKDTGSTYEISYEFPSDIDVEIPSYWDYENYVPVEAFLNQNGILTLNTLYPQIQIDGKDIINQKTKKTSTNSSWIYISSKSGLYFLDSEKSNTFLLNSDENTIDLYTRNNAIKTNIEAQNAKPCSNKDSIIASNNQVIISIDENSSKCLKIPIQAYQSSHVAEVKFTYSSTNLEKLKVCLEEDVCKTLTTFNDQDRAMSTTLIAKVSNKSNIQLLLENTGLEGDLRISDITITLYKRLPQLQISDLRNINTSVKIITSAQEIGIRIPKYHSWNTVLKGLKHQNHLDNNCNTYQSDGETSVYDDNATLTINTSKESFCLRLLEKPQMQDASFIISASANNISGQHLELRWYDHVLQQDISKIRLTDNDLRYLLWNNGYSTRDYLFAIWSTGRGEIPTINELNSVTWDFMPINFLQRVIIIDNNYPKINAPKAKIPVKLEYTRLGIGKYRIDSVPPIFTVLLSSQKSVVEGCNISVLNGWAQLFECDEMLKKVDITTK